MNIRCWGLVFTMMVLCACSANHKSIYRQTIIGDEKSTITTIDAKQRAILSSVYPASINGKKTTKVVNKDGIFLEEHDGIQGVSTRRFCSEPSPDVFAVIAQALSAGGSFGQAASPASVEATLKATFSSSEQGSTIPRTQTINMLRELMYRTCERYLNGAISGTELSIQAVRDQRLMVSILAIEQLTGAVTARPVVIGASGSASAGVASEALVRLDDARKARDAAVQSYTIAKKGYDETNTGDKVCEGIEKAEVAGTALTTGQEMKKEPCLQKKMALTSALEEQTKRQSYYSELQRLANGAGFNAETSVVHSAVGGLGRAHSESIASVAKVVKSIVEKNINDDSEALLFCIREIKHINGKIASVCSTYFENFIAREAQEISTESEKLKLEEIEVGVLIRNKLNEMFETFWRINSRVLKDGGSKKNALLDTLLKRLSKVLTMCEENEKCEYKIAKKCFKDAGTEQDYKMCFLSLRAPAQRVLVYGE